MPTSSFKPSFCTAVKTIVGEKLITFCSLFRCRYAHTCIFVNAHFVVTVGNIIPDQFYFKSFFRNNRLQCSLNQFRKDAMASSAAHSHTFSLSHTHTCTPLKENTIIILWPLYPKHSQSSYVNGKRNVWHHHLNPPPTYTQTHKTISVLTVSCTDSRSVCFFWFHANPRERERER